MATRRSRRLWWALAMPVSPTVNGLTLDPGYRFVAEQFDIAVGGCTCVGPGPIPDPVLIDWANQIKAQSLDPACAYLAGALAGQAQACCPTLPNPLDSEMAQGARNRTLDPGARLLGKLLDGFITSCCTGP